MKLHPYALIIGVVIGVMVLATLRHPLFALFASVLSVLGFDMAFKNRKNIDHKDDEK